MPTIDFDAPLVPRLWRSRAGDLPRVPGPWVAGWRAARPTRCDRQQLSAHMRRDLGLSTFAGDKSAVRGASHMTVTVMGR